MLFAVSCLALPRATSPLLHANVSSLSPCLQLAAGGDNRILIIATVFVPVIGWVVSFCLLMRCTSADRIGAPCVSVSRAPLL